MTTLTEEARRTLDSVRDRIENALDRLSAEQHSEGEQERPPHRLRYSGPPVDVEETPEVIFVRAELPGLRQRDLTIEVSGNRVTIRGLKQEEREGEGGESFHQQERQYGPFERTLYLPAEVDPEGATAAYKDGVLRLMLPKTPRAKARYLNVVAEAS